MLAAGGPSRSCHPETSSASRQCSGEPRLLGLGEIRPRRLDFSLERSCGRQILSKKRDKTQAGSWSSLASRLQPLSCRIVKEMGKCREYQSKGRLVRCPTFPPWQYNLAGAQRAQVRCPALRLPLAFGAEKLCKRFARGFFEQGASVWKG